MKTVDARGHSCPEPVIMTRKALEASSGQLKVLVDNQIAVENITRFARSRGKKVDIRPSDGDFELIIE